MLPAAGRIARRPARCPAAHPKRGLGPDEWIEGFGYDESKYPEGRGPTADDLDLVSSTQPVFVQRCDGHSSVANHRALELAGVTGDSADPAGRPFRPGQQRQPERPADRDQRHRRRGGRHPATDTRPTGRNIAICSSISSNAASSGSADLLATMVPAPLTTFRAAENGGLRIQCALYYGWPSIAADGVPDLTDADRTGRMKIAGLKLFMDGAYSNRTAWTEDPYPGSRRSRHAHPARRGPAGRGELGPPQHIQVAVHAMGDRALNHVLDMFGDEEPWLGDLPSIRLDHATLFSPEMIDRMNAARMSFAVVSHSIFLFAEYDSYQRNLSPSQFEIAYPIRSFFEQVPFTGIVVGLPRRPHGPMPTTSSSRSRRPCCAGRTTVPTSASPRPSPSHRRCSCTPAGQAGSPPSMGSA